MIRTVHLHGRLGEEFGSEHNLDIATPIESVRALMVIYRKQGFREHLREGHYRVVAGDMETGMGFEEETIGFQLGENTKHLHIIPVAAGSKKGIGKILAGIVLIGLAAFGSGFTLAGLTASTGFMGITYGQVGLLGAALLMTGIAESKAPGMPKMAPLEPVERRQSFLFNSVKNVTEQGNAVPLVYGRFRTGSVRVSIGMDSERVDLEN